MTARFLVAMAAPLQGAPSAWVQLLPFALVLAIFYFIILLPMKRRQQKVATFLSGLKEGDKVVTSGGIYGTITKVVVNGKNALATRPNFVEWEVIVPAQGDLAAHAEDAAGNVERTPHRVSLR